MQMWTRLYFIVDLIECLCLNSCLWIIKHRSDVRNFERLVHFQAIHPLMRTSQVSLSSNPDADFRYSSIFTQIGIYKGRVFAIKKVHKKSIDITREMKKELKMVRMSGLFRKIEVYSLICVPYLFVSSYLVMLIRAN